MSDDIPNSEVVDQFHNDLPAERLAGGDSTGMSNDLVRRASLDEVPNTVSSRIFHSFVSHRTSAAERIPWLMTLLSKRNMLQNGKKVPAVVVHAFSQTALGKRGSPPANNRNQNSEYLPQRRQGRKGRRKHVKIFRKNIFLFPPNLASLRLCGRHIRIRESSITGKFTQAARYDKHVGLCFRIVIRSSQSSEYLLIKNSSLRALRGSTGSPRPEPVDGRA